MTTKLSEKYRAIADLYAYLESRQTDCHCDLIDGGDGIEIRDSLYQELVASPAASKLIAAVEACGITVYPYDKSGHYIGNQWW